MPLSDDAVEPAPKLDAGRKAACQGCVDRGDALLDAKGHSDLQACHGGLYQGTEFGDVPGIRRPWRPDDQLTIAAGVLPTDPGESRLPEVDAPHRQSGENRGRMMRSGKRACALNENSTRKQGMSVLGIAHALQGAS